MLLQTSVRLDCDAGKQAAGRPQSARAPSSQWLRAKLASNWRPDRAPRPLAAERRCCAAATATATELGELRCCGGGCCAAAPRSGAAAFAAAPLFFFFSARLLPLLHFAAGRASAKKSPLTKSRPRLRKSPFCCGVELSVGSGSGADD